MTKWKNRSSTLWPGGWQAVVWFQSTLSRHCVNNTFEGLSWFLSLYFHSSQRFAPFVPIDWMETFPSQWNVLQCLFINEAPGSSRTGLSKDNRGNPSVPWIGCMSTLWLLGFPLWVVFWSDWHPSACFKWLVSSRLLACCDIVWDWLEKCRDFEWHGKHSLFRKMLILCLVGSDADIL